MSYILFLDKIIDQIIDIDHISIALVRRTPNTKSTGWVASVDGIILRAVAASKCISGCQIQTNDFSVVDVGLQDGDGFSDAARLDVSLTCENSKFFVAVDKVILLDDVDTPHKFLVLHEAVGQVVNALDILVMAKMLFIIQFLNI